MREVTGDLSAKVALLVSVSALGLGAGAARADDLFRVTGYRLTAESSVAEICVGLSRPLALADRSAILAAIELKKDGKKLTLQPRDLSLTERELCLQNLDHRSPYELTLDGLRAKDKTTLADQWSLAFAVPDRKPMLAFAPQAKLDRLPRLSEEEAAAGALIHPTLRATNVTATRLALYRFPERAAFAAAWANNARINLAPTESLTFAKEKGRVVWEGDLVFPDRPNEMQTQPAPIPDAKTLEPGLYFLAARPRSAPAAPVSGNVDPALFAGRWFLVTKMKLAAELDGEGVRVLALARDASHGAPGVAVQLMTREGRVLAEGKTGADGQAFLPLSKEQKESLALLVGQTAEGDADLIDLASAKTDAFDPLPLEASLKLDRALYRPGEQALAVLSARDSAGRPQTVEGSTLKILRPDASLYSEQKVSAEAKGLVFMPFQVPPSAAAGDWTALWARGDGRVLDRATLKLNDDPALARLELKANGASWNEDDLKLSVLALGATGKPQPWRAGQIFARAARPSFPGLKTYSFGSLPPDAPPLLVGRFVTGADGRAEVRLASDLVQKGGWDAVTLTGRLDRGASPASLTLPVARAAGWIGVRPLSDDKPFAENSAASFDFVAVDAAGNRRAMGDLYYQIYEDGRRFQWIPAEGHWAYQPLPDHRRIGGGPLALSAAGVGHLSWPVTAGHYVLEVTNAAGTVLAQRAFAAGWSGEEEKATASSGAQAASSTAGLTLASALSAPWDVRGDNKIKLTLDAPAMVSVLIGDDRVRQSFYRALPKGETLLPVETDESWGARVQVRAEAFFADDAKTEEGSARAFAILPLRHPAKELTLEAGAPASLTSGSVLSLPVTLNKNALRSASFVAAYATPFGAEGAPSLSSLFLAPEAVGREGKATLRFGVPSFTGNLSVTLAAWNEEALGLKTFSLPARPAFAVEGDFPAFLAPGDRVPVTLTLVNNSAGEGAFSFALALPKGVVAKGLPAKQAVTLPRGGKKTLSFTLDAQAPVLDSARLDVTTPSGEKISRFWPLTVRGGAGLVSEPSATLAPDQTRSFERGRALWLSPLPVPDLAAMLSQALAFEPVTTDETALWLLSLRPWARAVATMGLASESSFTRLRDLRRAQLLKRQRPDGGFAARPEGRDSDLASTASALIVLRDDPSLAQSPALQQAQDWMRRKLENTWFDEAERAVRARAFVALALAGRADPSAVRYFATTSKDKDLSPLSAASIALSLVRIGDGDEAAKPFVKRSRRALPEAVKADPDSAGLLLAALAQNERLSGDDLEADLKEAAAALGPLSDHAALSWLLGLGQMAPRLGAQNVVWDGHAATLDGIGVLSTQEEEGKAPLRQEVKAKAVKGKASPEAKEEKKELQKPPELKNTSGRALYVASVTSASGEDKTSALVLQRQLYRLDGEKLAEGASLREGEVYLETVRVSEKDAKDGAARVLTLTQNAGLEPLAALGPGGTSFKALWPWLAGPLAEVEDTMLSPWDVSFLYHAGADVRLVYLVRATRPGHFSAGRAFLRVPDGATLPATQTSWSVSIK